jgi:hypothetical protein
MVEADCVIVLFVLSYFLGGASFGGPFVVIRESEDGFRKQN